MPAARQESWDLATSCRSRSCRAATTRSRDRPPTPARGLLVMRAVTLRCLPIVLTISCGPPPPPVPPPAVAVDYELHGEIGEPPPLVTDQPPHIRLKLGHYRNDRVGIGVTVDLTEATESVADIDPAKLRFDGDDRIWHLEGQSGGRDRIDYVRDHDRVLLQVFRDGRIVVFVPDPATDRASDGIEVYRDGDADPL